jgi:hypothetical protein
VDCTVLGRSLLLLLMIQLAAIQSIQISEVWVRKGIKPFCTSEIIFFMS